MAHPDHLHIVSQGLSDVGLSSIAAQRRAVPDGMRVHLINPSDMAFGTAVITPRWLYVLGAATPAAYGRPRIVDETLEPLDLDRIQAADVVGIGVHTGNALRGYEIGAAARDRGATVVFGGIHATLFPEEAYERGLLRRVHRQVPPPLGGDPPRRDTMAKATLATANRNRTTNANAVGTAWPRR